MNDGNSNKHLHRMAGMDKLYSTDDTLLPFTEELQGEFHAPISGDIAYGALVYSEKQHDDSFLIPTDFIGKDEYFYDKENYPDQIYNNVII